MRNIAGRTKEKDTDIPRLRKGYDKKIYSLVSRIRENPFGDIRLPECIYDYAIAQKESVRGKAEVQNLRAVAKEETDKLDELLHNLDPQLRKRRQGAWRALRSDNPDKLSQAANSMVELLDKVIGQVCKDTDLATYLKKKYNIHGETKQIDATRKWISETKSNIHRIKHHSNHESEVLTEALLKSSELIMLVILE